LGVEVTDLGKNVCPPHEDLGKKNKPTAVQKKGK
jgi:hypothetical protein|tara:strand:+ start:1887 stop:1988 length:102 start_codon:yes stop_codon:yes gene_type:complete